MDDRRDPNQADRRAVRRGGRRRVDQRIDPANPDAHPRPEVGLVVAAIYLGITEYKLRTFCQQGLIVPVYRGKWLFRIEDLKALKSDLDGRRYKAS